MEVTLRSCNGLAFIVALFLSTGILQAGPLPSSQSEGTESPVAIVCSALENDAINISLQVGQFDLWKADANETGSDLILVDGEPGLEITDKPVLPFIARSVLIPSSGSVTLRLDNVVFDTRFDLTPVQARLDDNNLDLYADSFLRTHALPSRDPVESPEGFWPASPVEIGETAILRGYRVVNFRVYPVQHNAATGETRFNRQVEFHLEIPGADQQICDAPPRLRSINTWRIINSLVENPPPPLQRDDLLHANYLFIVPEAEQVDETIAPLIQWRTRQGHNVQVVHVPNNQNQAQVHAAIQAAYNSDTPVEYVALIGDAANSPFVVEAASNNGDYAYTTIDGNDPLPDVAIGRISADDIGNLAQIVNKLVSYETTPYMEDTTWFKHGAVIAGHQGNGLSTVLVAKYVRKELLALGFTEVRHWYHNENGEIPGGRQPFLTNCFDWGISILHYRAYQNMNNLQISEIDNLPNRRGCWPAVLAISCNTGDFVALDGYTEAFLRARGGSIGAIGTATAATATQYNNMMSGGVWKGVYKDKLFNMGWGLVTGKFELWRAYDGFDGRYSGFMDWNNLMGDPGTIIWTDVPRAIDVEHTENLAVGGSYALAHVTDAAGGEDEPDALVCLYKQGELHLTRYTDENGVAAFPIDPDALSEGDLLITVTKHNVYPYQGTIAVASQELFFGVTDATVNDAQGNNNGEMNPCEQVELRLSITNLGAQGANQRITVQAASLSPWVEITGQQVVINSSPAPGESAPASFTAVVDESCPDQSEVQVLVTITDQNNHTWTSMTATAVSSPHLTVARLPLNGAQLAPGSSYDDYNIEFANQGHAPLGRSRITMVETRELLEIRDAVADYDAFNAGQQHGASSSGFSFVISSLVMPGTPLDLTFSIESENGFRDTTTARMTVGVVAAGGPIGPDAYGYYCFDSGDVNYSMAPRFDWIEINPAIEGFDFPGTNLNLQDPSDNQDRSVAVDLPFPFQYYGESFNRLTICTNGWAAFGDQAELADFRNRQIGQALGPNAQLAVWWDNLVTVQGSAILTYYDRNAGHFIIEWSRMRRLTEGGFGATETFEIILFDPQYVPTASGDGLITFQYLNVSNEDRPAHNDTPFCTIGISNLDDSDGLQYTYWNQYPTGAQPIESNMALTFSTATAYITGTVQGRVFDFATGSPIPNACVSSRGVQSKTDVEGRYLLDLLIGDDYAITASANGWNDSTKTGFSVAEDETLTVDFQLLFSNLILSADHITDVMGMNQLHHHNLILHNSGNGRLTWATEQRYSEGESGIGQRIISRVLANIVQDIALEGIVWAEDHYFIAGQNGQDENMVYVLDENFTEVNRFPQVGHSRDGMKDITYGNGLLWGSGERNVSAFTTDGELVHQFAGPYSNNQALAFDTDRELIWIWATNGAIVAVDLDGNRVTQFPHPRLNIKGLAYWPDDPDDCNLYIVDDPLNDHQDIYRMNMTNGEVEIVNSLDTREVGQPGGIHITSGYGIYGTVLMIMINDYFNRPGDRLDVWQMGSYKGWMTLSAEEGVVEPQADRNLDVTLSSIGLFPAVYRAQLLFHHSGLGGESIVPVELTVDNRAVPSEPEPPNQFSIEAVWPNPFNAAVTLSYTLPASSDVKLVVYDLGGRAVREVVNVRQETGRHQVSFDAGDLPSGIYLARLTAGGKTRLVKIMCVK